LLNDLAGAGRIELVVSRQEFQRSAMDSAPVIFSLQAGL